MILVQPHTFSRKCGQETKVWFAVNTCNYTTVLQYHENRYFYCMNWHVLPCFVINFYIDYKQSKSLHLRSLLIILTPISISQEKGLVKVDDYMWVTGCRIGWGLVPRSKPRLMIICGLLAAELADDWFQGLSKGWWLYVGYWLQNWLRIASKV